MNYYNHIVETIGNTPLVKLNKVSAGIKGTILVKVEYMNPGNSVKDRIALKMIEDAEKEGLLKPGGTIIEGTSGNTGMGLALVAIAKGYRCIFTMADKQSQEKIDILRAVGAEVVVCPTNVEPDDPRSYYSVAKYLKEQKADIVTVGIDTYGSVFKKYKETGIFDPNEVYPYLTEGIGEDILPKNVDFSTIDHFVKVTDKDAAIMTRRLAREEGLFVGWSCGSAAYGALEYAKEHLTAGDVMVIILPDHGTRYLGKVYNDAWMAIPNSQLSIRI